MKYRALAKLPLGEKLTEKTLLGALEEILGEYNDENPEDPITEVRIDWMDGWCCAEVTERGEG